MPNSITLVNHATVLIRLGEIAVLTDPIYSRTISYFFPRVQKAGIPFNDLPAVDHILISHHDYDHLNLKTLRRLRRRGSSGVILPRGLASYARRAGFERIVEMSVWEEFEENGLRITSVPAKHVSNIKARDDNRSACCGYVLQTDSRCVYFAGDTGYADFFQELGDRFSIDVALLPIGAYKPYNWFKDLHLHPTAATQAFLDLRAKHLVPIHWGTFWISDEPMGEPPVLLRHEAEQRSVQDRIHILKNGEQFVF